MLKKNILYHYYRLSTLSNGHKPMTQKQWTRFMTKIIMRGHKKFNKWLKDYEKGKRRFK